MLHRLCEPPSIPLSFSLATVLPRRGTYRLRYDSQGIEPRLPSAHRLQRGLPGYLIPFAPHAFVPQRQMPTSEPPSPPAFRHISTHFTATRDVPLPPPALKPDRLEGCFRVEPGAFTSHKSSRLRTL